MGGKGGEKIVGSLDKDRESAPSPSQKGSLTKMNSDSPMSQYVMFDGRIKGVRKRRKKGGWVVRSIHKINHRRHRQPKR